jgi:hypothetical protein
MPQMKRREFFGGAGCGRSLHRVAALVDRIFKGAKAADLPF